MSGPRTRRVKPTEVAVPSAEAVEAFDVSEDLGADLVFSLPASPVDQLFL
jgi:hypothetical protein